MGGHAPGSTGPERWRNWSRTESAAPRRVSRPRDLDELVDEVTAATASGERLRAVGAGHSFSAAAVTDGVHVHLDALARFERVTPRPDGTTHVTVGAGMRLHALNRGLAARGLAMRNLGDIDRQSVAGAISTGTHGTGARLGGLPTQVVGLRVVTASGDVVEASRTHEAELFELARLGLGTAGVLAAVTLEVVPAFRLLAREEAMPLPAVLEGLDELVDGHDHFEFFWFPHTTSTLTKRNDVTDDVDRPLPVWRHVLDDELLANVAFGAAQEVATRSRRLTPALNRFQTAGLPPRTYTAASHEVLVSPRRVRFREAEYAVPRESVRDVVHELAAWFRATGAHVPFPLEVRFAAADDVWLSTAHGRETAYVAVQQYHRLPHRRYFDAAEQIVAAVGGRPHWGKMHGLDHGTLASLYPRLADANRVRARVDPAGTFRNAYVDRVLGPAH
jgi:FAD-linked oxidoreductase